MRYLFVGAGALGGYFGGRLLDAGVDVTYLLRPGRAAQLRETGLILKSPQGDLALPAPPSVQADAIGGPYDVVVVACKAFDLASTMDAFAPAVGRQSAVLPLLNGMAHMDALAGRFGRERVLGGLCMISAALDPQGRVQHFNDLHTLAFGEPGGARSPRIEAIAADFGKARFDARASDDIVQAMWEKWMFIASTAGITCLMRAAVGDIVRGGGADAASALLAECAAIAAHNGHAPSDAALQRGRAMLTAADSAITASMLKDMERGGAIEADHIIGDLLRRGAGGTAPLLALVQVHLKAYEARRAREASAAG